MDELLIHWRPGRCVPAIPTHDGLTIVSCCWPVDGWRDVRTDVAGRFAATVDSGVSAEFAERFRAARRVAPFVGSQQSANLFRRPYGPGWALVGDAGSVPLADSYADPLGRGAATPAGAAVG